MMNIYLLMVISLTLFYGGLILFYFFGWLNLSTWKITPVRGSTKVTVIVPARNEETNIANCISGILAQDYPTHLLEIIIVDDFSTDNTVAEIKKFNVPNLRLLQMKKVLNSEEQNQSFKKLAIEKAVQQANGDLIITTDADCIVGKQWVSAIVSFYESTGYRFIVSPVAFINDTTFFERIQSLDFIGLMGISGGAIQFKFPAMCNGANLTYEKKVFTEVSGFSGVSKVASGDDMMLMQKVNAKYPGSVGYLKSTKATVFTYAQPTLKSFVQQRLRWISKSGYYPDKRITIVLTLAYLFNLTLLGNAVLSFISIHFLPLFLLQLGIKLVTEFIFLLTVTKFFNRQALLILFLPAQLLHVLYVVVIGLLGNFVTYHWKGRKTR